MEGAPVEPDLTNPWNRNVWLYGLRTPFSLVFLSWITFAQALSPVFNLEIYGYSILAALFGLIVGAHYIDISTSVEKFSPFFTVPKIAMLRVGLSFVALGFLVGVYMSLRWNILFLAFVLVESFAAVGYPREAPRFAHSYFSFALTWGAIPFLGSYFIQVGSLNLTILGVSVFVGISVLMMHHLAIMTRESRDWPNAIYLLLLYRYSVYSIALLSLLGRLLSL